MWLVTYICTKESFPRTPMQEKMERNPITAKVPRPKCPKCNGDMTIVHVVRIEGQAQPRQPRKRVGGRSNDGQHQLF